MQTVHYTLLVFAVKVCSAKPYSLRVKLVTHGSFGILVLSLNPATPNTRTWPPFVDHSQRFENIRAVCAEHRLRVSKGRVHARKRTLPCLNNFLHSCPRCTFNSS
uniref:Uncharacterized protein n=1 Tax=Glypta fumiferanae TaxID=389681 RepID=A0A0F6Q8G3_9HYME|nr:hypothetical protein [Glypta fumiferanae]